MFILLLCVVTVGVVVVHGLGEKRIVSFQKVSNAIALVDNETTAQLIIDENDWSGVIRASKDLSQDFYRVTGRSLKLILYTPTSTFNATTAILVGTIGRSILIDTLVRSGKLDVSSTSGKWESYQTSFLPSSSLPGVGPALVVAGSDKRGTIYGLYTVSEQIGVSPWYFWADVPVVPHASVYALDTTLLAGPPSVKYRGIFLNDEEPALTNWINANYPRGKYGPGYNHAFYSLVFELLLRLKANLIWPAMWNSMFGIDDPLNRATADAYGIVVSTSHTEPLQRSTKEWNTFGNGPWNYTSNGDAIRAFWVEGVQMAKPYENYWTMGMRGNGDNVLSDKVQMVLLEKIMSDQRVILQEVLGEENLTKVPQVWCLYKDILAYYEEGMPVPDDITLLFTDDNYGNIRRLPVANDTKRMGGCGVYYHLDYVGSPRDYKWINTVQLQKTWEQMHLAYQRQARQIWIVNVGDLKPLEIPIDYFLSLAYDFDTWGVLNKVRDWELAWATREFGSDHAVAIASLLDSYGFHAARRKYELVDPTTYSLINYGPEADAVVDEWKALAAEAEALYASLPSGAQPAFFELLLHPVKAAYILHDLYLSVAKNNLYANQRRSSANAYARRALQRFQDDHAWTVQYNEVLLGGKWRHMMDQTHLGYNYWQQPMRNTLPPIAWVQLVEDSLAGSMGLTVEGSNGSVPGDDRYNSAEYGNDTLVLPPLDPYASPSSRWINIFNKGTQAFTFTVRPRDAWIKVSPSSGNVLPPSDTTTNDTDVRVTVSVDWNVAPEGYHIAYIDVISSTGSYGNFDQPSVSLPVNKTHLPVDYSGGYVETDGHVSMEALHYARSYPSTTAAYVVVDGLGRTLSSVMLFPVTAPTQSPTLGGGAMLEYDLYLFTHPESGIINVIVYLSVAMNQYPHRPLRYAVALDDDPEPVVVQFIPDAPPLQIPAGWEKAVEDSVWTSVTSHVLKGTGKKTLKYWALEPGVVLQKIVVDLGGVRQSYLGPPETMRVRVTS